MLQGSVACAACGSTIHSELNRHGEGRYRERHGVSCRTNGRTVAAKFIDPQIAEKPDVYLYSVDDLQAACDRNRRERDKQLPLAMRIIEQETGRFMTELHRRATGGVIRQLKLGWEKPKEEELQRLLNKLPDLDDRARAEIGRSFDRLVNKLLHPPLESLREESRHGIPEVLLDALSRLFQLKD